VKLPPPFQSATGLKPNLDGSIDLIDASGKPLARISMPTAFELSPLGDKDECDFKPSNDGSGDGDFGYGTYGKDHGDGSGDGFGIGYGEGFGIGVAYGQGYISGKGKSP